MVSSMARAVAVMTLVVPIVAGGAISNRDDAPVFSPQRVNIPLGFGAAGQYVMPVNMATGDNTQNFNFTLAMNSGLTYVAGQGCSTCSNIALYDQSRSTTAQALNANATTNFLTDTSSGPVIKETCSIQTSNGSNWVYPNQTVVVIQNQQANGFGQLLGGFTGVSGIVGLGTNLNSQPSSSGGGFQAAFADSIYGQWLNRNPTASNFSFGMALSPPAVRRNNGSTVPSDAAGTNAGVLNWMQPDSSMYKGDQITFKPVDNSANGGAAGNSGSPPSNAPSSEWSLSLDGWVFADGDNRISNTRSVVADVEALYTELYFPQDQATLLHAAIKGSSLQPNLGSLGPTISRAWTIPCDAQFSFGFVVGSQTFTLDHNSLVIRESDGTCVSAIEAWADPNQTKYLLGSSFISSIYLIFQINRDGTQVVGFAPFADPPKKSSHTGAIVGGVIGGVAFLVIVALSAFFLSRYYHRKSTLGTFDPQLDETKAPTPYTLGAPTGEVSIYTPNGASANAARQSYLPVSAGTSVTDPLFANAMSESSQYAPELISPPAYDASEASFAAANPGVAHNRVIREKGGHSVWQASNHEDPSAGSSST
ncbi:unnamed protein product [Somion occarium]